MKNSPTYVQFLRSFDLISGMLSVPPKRADGVVRHARCHGAVAAFDEVITDFRLALLLRGVDVLPDGTSRAVPEREHNCRQNGGAVIYSRQVVPTAGHPLECAR